MSVELPAWVSPLYKTYGIGGPYGRHGPFVEPSFLAQGGLWDSVLRQAEGLGALNVPGVITEMGRLDLSGLCSEYNQLKREEIRRLALENKWKCKPCIAFKNFFNKVKSKMGIKPAGKKIQVEPVKPAEGATVPESAPAHAGSIAGSAAAAAAAAAGGAAADEAGGAAANEAKEGDQSRKGSKESITDQEAV
ncbi:hypothetical protein PoB_006267300 [Plakobranchus ocellatus]|uniref:Uncharacterized protein n=1 Tax=Plakobranchus ocellatus TaxID=259542 RepID=A0AAV4CW96_9GAST|nr:hypothetical protein PoB_006267300 [Plakobranchus ocellatus]